jgi:hypothetical protein
MGLIEFYKYVDNQILSILSNKYNLKYNILICFVDGNEHYSKKNNITKIDIGKSDYFKKNIMKINNKIEKYNIINIRFSIEYYFNKSCDLKLLMQFLNEHLLDNGYLIIYTLSEEKINSYFMRNITLIGKYKILPLYDVTDTLSSYGKEIVVGKEPHDECIYIVDIDEIKLIAEKYNISYIGEVKFSSFAESFFKTDNILYTDDLQAIFLCKIHIFRKK